MRNLMVFLSVAAIVSFAAACSAGTGLCGGPDNTGKCQYQSDGLTITISGGGLLYGLNSMHANGGVKQHSTTDNSGPGSTSSIPGWFDNIWAKKAAGTGVGRTGDDDGDGQIGATTTSLFSAGISSSITYFGASGDCRRDAYVGGSPNLGTAINSGGLIQGVRTTTVGQGVKGLSYAQVCQLLQSINQSTDVSTTRTNDGRPVEHVTVSITSVTVNGESINFDRGELTVDLVDLSYAQVSNSPAYKMFAAWFTDEVDSVRARGEELDMSMTVNGSLKLNNGDLSMVNIGDTDAIRAGAGLD